MSLASGYLSVDRPASVEGPPRHLVRGQRGCGTRLPALWAESVAVATPSCTLEAVRLQHLSPPKPPKPPPRTPRTPPPASGKSGSDRSAAYAPDEAGGQAPTGAAVSTTAQDLSAAKVQAVARGSMARRLYSGMKEARRSTTGKHPLSTDPAKFLTKAAP